MNRSMTVYLDRIGRSPKRFVFARTDYKCQVDRDALGRIWSPLGNSGPMDMDDLMMFKGKLDRCS